MYESTEEEKQAMQNRKTNGRGPLSVLTDLQNCDIWTNKKLDVEKIEIKIKKLNNWHHAEIARMNLDEDNMCFDTSSGRESSRLSTILGILDFGVEINKYWGGFVEINNKYVFSLSSYKWRMKGKNVWSKRGMSSIKDFITKIVNTGRVK